jgi:hypothetical protein
MLSPARAARGAGRRWPRVEGAFESILDGPAPGKAPPPAPEQMMNGLLDPNEPGA